MAVYTNELGMLHVKLAERLGDPRTSAGSLISSVTCPDDVTDSTLDGIRYTAKYRNRLIHDALRWLLLTFDPVFLIEKGIAIGDSSNGLQLYYEDVSEGTGSNPVIPKDLRKILRLLRLALYSSDKLREWNNIPIIAPTYKKMARYKHNHWSQVPVCYLKSRTEVYIINYPSLADSSILYYIQDFDDQTMDINIGITKDMHEYIIGYALHLDRLNGQRSQEGIGIKDNIIQEINLIKQRK